MMIRAREVGRLVELRYIPPTDVADLDERAVASLVEFLEAVPNAVMCVDLRRGTVLPPHLADRLTALMQGIRGHFERCADIVSTSQATAHMQIERISRASADPARRVFTDPHAAIRWLDEVLDPEERARLRIFLLGPGQTF
ncbi:hypothetical protein LVJ94_23920 [Pendulispora rubella]|uniref:STAS/SEC14 domain-containing protein n=1 Tax=Pendulispora rubella TaxID=2741070 RepID=A0ABZ2LH47_9BACT